MDLSSAIVPVFGGEYKRLYRDSQLYYIISDVEHPKNHPIYAQDVDLGSPIFHIHANQKPLPLIKPFVVPTHVESENVLWKLFFDGASSRKGLGFGVVLIPPTNEVITLSYKLEFEITNNIAEYEALLLGLRAAKDMKIQHLKVQGDSELVVPQVRNIYQTMNVRLRSYRNEVWDIIKNFFLVFSITFIPRNLNERAYSLAIAASNFRITSLPKLRYEVEVRHHPFILDNIKHWRVFEEDNELIIFLQTVEEFSDIHIDQERDILVADQNIPFLINMNITK